MKLGTPIAAQDTLTNLSFLVVNAVINNMGVVTSAGYGIAQKVVSFILLMPSAFGSAMSAFVAQNIGAKNIKRVKQVVWKAIIITTLFGGIFGAFSAMINLSIKCRLLQCFVR